MQLMAATWLLALAALAAWPAGALAQPADARDLYYQRADQDAEEDDVWLGVRTSILVERRDRRQVRTEVRETSDQDSFRSGERFRLSVQANVRGYLYLLVHGSDGEVDLLFPYERERGTNVVQPFRSQQVPDGGAWFQFDKATGLERVYLFLSARRLPELERAVGDGEHLDERDLERLVDDAGDNAWKLYDELDAEGDTLRTYYVEQPETEMSYLVRTFDMEHR